MEFKQPDLICPKCGGVIPPNAHDEVVSGRLVTVGEGITGKLICKECTIKVMPPPPKRPLFPRGSVVAEQSSFGDAPMLKID